VQIEKVGAIYHCSYGQLADVTATANFEVWLDTERGYSPIRFERRVRDNLDRSKWATPDVVNSSTWRLIDDVWVPESWRIEAWGPSFTSKETCELAFEWEGVNKPINEGVFTSKGFGMKKGQFIAESIEGKVIVDEVVGGGPRPINLTERRPSVFLRTPYIQLLAAGGAVLAVAAAMFGLKHARQAAKRKPT
jgi:hypothetical protein